MSFILSERAQQQASKTVKQPNIVICFDGVDTCYGSAKILKIIKIGDPGLYIDGSWLIGGFSELENQLTAVDIDKSTSSIKQQLDIDKGRGGSISSMEIGLIDFDGEISQLVSPGIVVDDILGRKAVIYLGFADNTSFPEDYITIFRGIVDDIKSEQGVIKLNVAHPDQKKRQLIYAKRETQLDGAITSGDTTLTVLDTSGFLLRANGPSGSPDTSFTSYVRIDDEIISYTGKTATTFTGCSRGQLGTIAAAHDDEAQVDSYYRLEGNSIDLALKIMLSGWQGNYKSGVSITNFVVIGDLSSVANSIFFRDVNLESSYGLTVGDYVTTSGALNGANNVTDKEILDIVVDDYGTYLIIDGVSFVSELDSAGTIAFRSQYDSLPEGLKMSPDEVDVTEHLRVQRLFLSSFDYDFYLKDTIENAGEFIEQQVYKPAGAYSLPRKAQSSVGYFIGPLPSASTITLNNRNITKPDTLKIRRTINKNFANTIVYKWEVDPLEDKFLRGRITQSATSLAQIPIGTKALVIEAEGMRDDLIGGANALAASNRRIDRYQFGSEFLEGVNITYEYGFNIEIGDIVILDGSRLNLLDSTTGERNKPAKFFEIQNKTLNIKTGNVVLDLVDTGFDGFQKYGLVGPSSRIKVGLSQTEFIIEQAYPSIYGAAEHKKWSRFTEARVKVRSSDFTTRFAQSFIANISGNTITVDSSLGFIPQAGDVMELADHDFTGVTEEIKLLYVHMSLLNGGTDDPYVML